MQLRDLMSLIDEAEFLQDWETGLGQEYGELKSEHYRNLPPNEFGDFLERVHSLVKGVIKLKDSSI